MRAPVFRWLVRRLAPLLVLVATSDIGLCAHFHYALFVPGTSAGASVSVPDDPTDHHECGVHADCFCHGCSTADRPAVEWSDPSLISPLAERAVSSTPIPIPLSHYHPPPAVL
jgi:hypothetical protein